ncbi:aminomethyl-transferring glycine dehydrogenase subunit GcvPA [bacterium]|nr:aminomethyl-transferring glycine dehydrogenase subunit GcvPA [bacterium]
MPYVPHTPQQRQAMLETIGVASFEELLSPIPRELILDRPLNVPPAHGEVAIMRLVSSLISQNQFIPMNRVYAGQGFYPHHVPAVVDELARRGEWYTAYTPYQPEVSQGLLQCIYEWQSYICMLTGMEVCNASGYDGGTTLADAVVMAKYHHKDKKKKVLLAPYLNPEAVEILATYNLGMEMELLNLPADSSGRVDRAGLEALLDENTAAVVFQYPDYLGYLEEELESLIALVHSHGATAVVSFYPYAAGLVKSPGELGADIVCGEAQCLGNYMAYGGPVCGYLACTEKYVRVLPGRLIGRASCERRQEDGSFAPGEAFVMTLQAREQHIRREKATSNICTNQTLLALRAVFYMGAIGRQGFMQNAELSHSNAVAAREALLALPGAEDYYPGRAIFNEFTLRFPAGKATQIFEKGLSMHMLPGLAPRHRIAAPRVGGSSAADAQLGDCLTFAFTEVHTERDIKALVGLCEGALK